MENQLKNILCIDDEEDIVEVAKTSFEVLSDFKVEGAIGGREGIKKAEELKPDLILLDVMMPEMDGIATLKALRENPIFSGTPIVFMTARVQPAEVAHYKTLGVEGVIAKPFDPESLVREVENYWRSFHARK